MYCVIFRVKLYCTHLNPSKAHTETVCKLLEKSSVIGSLRFNFFIFRIKLKLLEKLHLVSIIFLRKKQQQKMDLRSSYE